LWIHVIPHFSSFLRNLDLDAQDRSDAESKADRVARCLWNKYYLGDFESSSYVIVGSYGKKTAGNPPSDLDMLFLLPMRVYTRIEGLEGNKQSQLLQEVKRSLQLTFPKTDLRADGQVVKAPFQTYAVEVVPAFALQNGTYLTANTENNGSWRISNPSAEYNAILHADYASQGKGTHLLKMVKAWKAECSVEIKSISLEVLVCKFVSEWQFRHQTLYYYDWLVRDFFEFLLRYKNGSTRVPGTDEWIQLGDDWYTKCETAHKNAVRACEHEHLDFAPGATFEWQKIFGLQFGINWRHVMAIAAAAR
jgi:Second Messenger Oligonucleotide or Dinucleotide Synthetase domain